MNTAVENSANAKSAASRSDDPLRKRLGIAAIILAFWVGIAICTLAAAWLK